MKEITLEDLKEMRPNSIFASGIVENSPDGIYMTDSRKGDKMVWIAKRGGMHDWTIYIGWEENGISNEMDKVRNKENIKKLVPCSADAYNMYRF